MSSPKYKLCYFQARGFGEMCRMLFVENGTPYEDVRYSGEDWPKHKPTMMFGQMPVLVVDGEQIAHSRAALRYLAREFQLDGGNSLNAAKVDMWVEVMIEGFSKLPFSEKDEKKKAELAKIAMTDHIVPRLQKYEEKLGSVYLFGDKLSAADVVVYCLVDALKRRIGEEFLGALPKVKAMVTAFEVRPKISKWLKERPVTEN